PAALRGAVGRRQRPPPLLHQSARLIVRKVSQRIRLRAQASLRKTAQSLRLAVRYSPEEGVMEALAPSPLPSPLSDLTLDGVLPQERGRRPPCRLLPLLLPLVVVSPPSIAVVRSMSDRGPTCPDVTVLRGKIDAESLAL